MATHYPLHVIYAKLAHLSKPKLATVKALVNLVEPKTPLPHAKKPRSKAPAR